MSLPKDIAMEAIAGALDILEMGLLREYVNTSGKVDKKDQKGYREGINIALAHIEAARRGIEDARRRVG